MVSFICLVYKYVGSPKVKKYVITNCASSTTCFILYWMYSRIIYSSLDQLLVSLQSVLLNHRLPGFWKHCGTEMLVDDVWWQLCTVLLATVLTVCPHHRILKLSSCNRLHLSLPIARPEKTTKTFFCILGLSFYNSKKYQTKNL